MLGNMLHQHEKITQNLSWFFLNSEPYLVSEVHKIKVYYMKNWMISYMNWYFPLFFTKFIQFTFIFFFFLSTFSMLPHHITFLSPALVFSVFVYLNCLLTQKHHSHEKWIKRSLFLVTMVQKHGYITSKFMFKSRSKIMKFL